MCPQRPHASPSSPYPEVCRVPCPNHWGPTAITLWALFLDLFFYGQTSLLLMCIPIGLEPWGGSLWPEHFHVQTRISSTLFAMSLMGLDGTREDTRRSVLIWHLHKPQIHRTHISYVQPLSCLPGQPHKYQRRLNQKLNLIISSVWESYLNLSRPNMVALKNRWWQVLLMLWQAALTRPATLTSLKTQPWRPQVL